MQRTIIFKGIEFQVEFDYQPEEKEYFNYIQFSYFVIRYKQKNTNVAS
jgi:hypothetical protein